MCFRKKKLIYTFKKKKEKNQALLIRTWKVKKSWTLSSANWAYPCGYPKEMRNSASWITVQSKHGNKFLFRSKNLIHLHVRLIGSYRRKHCQQREELIFLKH